MHKQINTASKANKPTWARSAPSPKPKAPEDAARGTEGARDALLDATAAELDSIKRSIDTLGDAKSTHKSPSTSSRTVSKTTNYGKGTWEKCEKCNGCTLGPKPTSFWSRSTCAPCTGCSHILYAINGTKPFMSGTYKVRAPPPYPRHVVAEKGTLTSSFPYVIPVHIIPVRYSRRARCSSQAFPIEVLRGKRCPVKGRTLEPALECFVFRLEWEVGASSAHILRVQRGDTPDPDTDDFVK
eukprot:2393002-Pyramimonas_sp.AAC.1